MKLKHAGALLAVLVLAMPPAALLAQSLGGGVTYTSYLPFVSLYNKLDTENSITGNTSTTSGFKFSPKEVSHYAPGGAVTFTYAQSGLLTTVDLGLMAGPGKDNIIPNFPARPFIALNAGYKFVKTSIFGLYAIGGLYVDFAYSKGKANYEFLHMLVFLRAGPGFSLKFGPTAPVEFFIQAQLAIGIQLEQIELNSKAGNDIYKGTYLMVPLALFPEAGIRLWF